MKKTVLLSICGLLGIMYSCGGDKTTGDQSAGTPVTKTETSGANENPAYDPHRGEGKFKDVTVDEKLNVQMAEGGEKIFNVKCSSCHKLTDEKLVGPGWLGVSKRRQPSWIMNFITNTDAMIDKDPQAQAMLELCLVRMPNQSLSDEEARNLLEFMRKNDGITP